MEGDLRLASSKNYLRLENQTGSTAQMRATNSLFALLLKTTVRFPNRALKTTAQERVRSSAGAACGENRLKGGSVSNGPTRRGHHPCSVSQLSC
jgi:hypothetical protein